jgi:lipopolysaccharide transport system ATP-binding protein
MSEVAHEGRAILFVSHNLEAVQRLCDRCIWIEGGQVQMDGETGAVVRAYVEHGDKAAASYQAQRHMSDAEPVVLREAALLNTAGEPCDAVCFGEPFSVKLQWGFAKSMADVEFVTQVRDSNERLIFSSSTEGSAIEVEAGTFTSTCHVRENILRPGDYALTVSCMRGSRTRLHRVERCLRIRVLEVPARGRQLVKLHREALVAPDTRWDASIAEPAAATR